MHFGTSESGIAQLNSAPLLLLLLELSNVTGRERGRERAGRHRGTTDGRVERRELGRAEEKADEAKRRGDGGTKGLHSLTVRARCL